MQFDLIKSLVRETLSREGKVYCVIEEDKPGGTEQNRNLGT